VPIAQASQSAAGTALRPWAILTWNVTGWKDLAVGD
jgi:hypothetical protein